MMFVNASQGLLLIYNSIQWNWVVLTKRFSCFGTHQSYTQDLGESVGRATRGGKVECCTWSLEPRPLTGPNHITQRQDGCTQAQGRPVYCHHNGFLEVDECQHKVPAKVTERSVSVKIYGMWKKQTNKRARERFPFTVRHLRYDCSLSFGQWTDALWGRMAPGHCRRQSPQSWAAITYYHQQLHCLKLDKLPS